MELRPLGTTGLTVPSICLGTMTWGRQNTEAEGHAQMDLAVDRGVTFFDTAEMYAVPPTAETYGRTEEIIGTWFKARGNRDRIVLATKMIGPGSRFPYVRGGTSRLDAASVAAAVDGSLRRLQTDYIDLYQTHWPNRHVNIFGTRGFSPDPDEDLVDPAETLAALEEQVKAGKIRHVGVSNETPWGVMRHLGAHADRGLPRIHSIQNAYNLLNREFEDGLAEIAIRERVGLLAYSPLAGGTLTGKYLGGAIPPGSRRSIDGRGSRYDKPNAEAATRRYLAIAKEHGLDPVQMAIAFVAGRPFVTSAIIGATGIAQLETNLGAHDLTLPDEVLAAIEAVQADIPNPCP